MAWNEDAIVVAVAERELVTRAHLIVQTAEALAHRFVLREIHGLPSHVFVEQATRLLTGDATAKAGSTRRAR